MGNSERDENTRSPDLPLDNLYAGQESTVRTGHGTTDWFQIGKGVRQGCILSPCLFNFYAEYIMRNAGLEETRAGIKIAGRNIYNLRYADDTTLMAESEEEQQNLSLNLGHWEPTCSLSYPISLALENSICEVPACVFASKRVVGNNSTVTPTRDFS